MKCVKNKSRKLASTVIGATGLLGRVLLEQWKGDEITRAGSRDADVRDPAQLKRIFERCRPEWTGLAAAYDDVDGCVRDPKRAHQVNCVGAEALTDHCAERPSLDCRKLKHELGWARAWEFERGLGETIGWYQANPPWQEILRGEYQKYFDRHYLRRAETLAAAGPAGS